MNDTFTRWYLTYEQGNSSKFYEVIYYDGRFAKRWGRIGAPKGQMQVLHGRLGDAEDAAWRKAAKGYEYQDIASRYTLTESLSNDLTRAFDQENAGTVSYVVDRAMRAALEPTEAAAGEATTVQHLDLLNTRAQNLVPLVAADPFAHITDIAEVREKAEEQRTKLRRLDAHLSTLDALLTSRV